MPAQTEAEKQLAQLVSMPTLSDDIAANKTALDYVQAYLEKRGMYCTRHEIEGHSSLVAASRPTNAKTPAVLLAGHIDVMAGSNKLFTLRREGDRLLGRGVYDMKFALAGYMQWVNDHQDTLADYDLAIMITSDEEYGGRDNISSTRHLVDVGYLPKVCILPDSTAPGWQIEQTAKGTWRFDLIANGRSAHGSRPWEGDSAAVKLINALHEFNADFSTQGPETHSINIAVIEGGRAFNQIPECMQASIELRLTSQDAYDHFGQRIQQLCEQHNLTFRERKRGWVLEHDLNHPLIQHFADSVHKVTDNRPKGFMSCGLSDATYFVAQGVPTIVSCPEGGGHHSEEEWLSRTSFLQFVPILDDYLKKVAKIPIKQVDVDREIVLV